MVPRSLVRTLLFSIISSRRLFGYMRMRGDEACNSVLNDFEIVKSLRRADDEATHAYRVYNHGSGRRDKRVIGCDGKRNTDGMAVSDDQ